MDGEPYFLDHKVTGQGSKETLTQRQGFHEDVHYEPEKNLRVCERSECGLVMLGQDGNVNVKVEIFHHAVATLVESPDVYCCAIKMERDGCAGWRLLRRSQGRLGHGGALMHSQPSKRVLATPSSYDEMDALTQQLTKERIFSSADHVQMYRQRYRQRN